MSTLRSYNYKDVDMILASKTIAESLRQNITELSTVRTTWTAEFVTQLAANIESVIESYLGIDNNEKLRTATESVLAIQQPAMRALSSIKTQIEVDFGSSSNKILKKLGLSKNSYYNPNGDQEALIETLYSFKKGLSSKLKEQMVSNGTNPTLIDNIIGYSTQLAELNQLQESLKTSSKQLSSDAIETFNSIYDQIIGICKIASNHYHNNDIKREQFTFSKVVSKMNMKAKNPEPEMV